MCRSIEFFMKRAPVQSNFPPTWTHILDGKVKRYGCIRVHRCIDLYLLEHGCMDLPLRGEETSCRGCEPLWKQPLRRERKVALDEDNFRSVAQRTRRR